MTLAVEELALLADFLRLSHEGQQRLFAETTGLGRKSRRGSGQNHSVAG